MRSPWLSPAPLFLLVTALLSRVVAAAPGPVILSGLAPDAYGHFDADQCRGCNMDRDALGLCANSCVTCQDAGRTTFAGDHTTTGCGQFDGNQAGCTAAWQLAGEGTPTSCFFDGSTNTCQTCIGTNQLVPLHRGFD